MQIPKLIAHRGASGYAPENTLLAFKQAKALGASMVELDVMLSLDGEAVVIHDENIKRTTNGKGLVNSFTLKELQEFDAGRWFSRKTQGLTIPTFKEVLGLLDELELTANIEIKPFDGFESETVSKVMSELNQYWPYENDLLLISSFNISVLEKVRDFSPEQPLGFLMHSWDDSWQAKAEQLNCCSVHVNQRLLTQKRVDLLKSSGMTLLAYTVNRSRKANKLFKMGVDGIFTDYPDLF